MELYNYHKMSNCLFAKYTAIFNAVIILKDNRAFIHKRNEISLFILADNADIRNCLESIKFNEYLIGWEWLYFGLLTDVFQEILCVDEF